MIGLSLALRTAAPPDSGMPSAPALFQSANADGWSVTYASPPALDPVASPETFTVTRAGFDAAGAATAVADTLTCMARLRQAYPNQASLTADQEVLSDYIHAGEVIAGGAANSSARQYPRPVSMWLMSDMLRATGSVTARLAVAHMYARNGRPVAAVKFILSDGTNTVEQTVSAPVHDHLCRLGPHGAAFRGDVEHGHARPERHADARYPWVGAEYLASVHGVTPPTVSFAPTRVFNDVSYGTAYAYIDAVSGNNATGVASTTPATAAANPYLTTTAAVAAIRAFNNTNFGRDNASGGVVRLVAGLHTYGSLGTTQTGTMGDLPVEIEAADPGARTTTIVQDAGANTTSPARCVFRNITIRRNASATVNFISSSAGLASPNFTVFDAVAFDVNGFASFPSAWINAPGRVWMLDCTANAGGLCGSSSTVNKAVNIIGGTVPPADASYNVAGCHTLNAALSENQHGVGNREATKGLFVGFSHLGRNSTSANILSAGVARGLEGFALVGCVLEDLDGTTAAALVLWGDGNTSAVQNIVLQMNTVVGERTNFLYQDIGTVTVAKSSSVRFCVFTLFNTKTDVFASNANLIGNWPAAFKAGFRSNAYLQGGSNGSGFGTGSWIGEIRGLGDVTGSVGTPLAAAFAAPAAPGAGNGDYTPGSGSALPFIPAGLAPYSHDMLGRAVANDGTARVGAVMAV